VLIYEAGAVVDLVVDNNPEIFLAGMFRDLGEGVFLVAHGYDLYRLIDMTVRKRLKSTVAQER